MNKEQQCRTSKKYGKLLRDIFFHKQSFSRCPEIPCGYCVCLLLSPCRTEGTILSTTQRTACVAQKAGTLSGSQYPNGVVAYCQTRAAQYGSVWVTPTFGGGNATHTAPLQTEPTSTLRWKCAK